MAAAILDIPTLPRQSSQSDSSSDPQGSAGPLAGLVRPRFFAGQLLNDQDLGLLLDWTGGRLSLSRHRHGWGVACGLHLRRGSGGLVVEPGYAVDPEGRDVVVPEGEALDLSGICGDPAYAAHRSRNGDDPPPRLDFGGHEVDGATVYVADVVLTYAEELAEPQAPLKVQACAERVACEHSRTLERFTLGLYTARFDRTPLDDEADAWLEAMAATFEAVARFRQEAAGKTEDEVYQWLRRTWIADHPPRVLGWLGERLERLYEDGRLGEEAAQAEILFWLVQDARLAVLGAGCACAGGGVPLGRVWVHDSGLVLAVDDRPPFRRELSGDAWPAPAGKVNLARGMWRRWEEGCRWLRHLGFDVARVEEARLPQRLDDLEELKEELRGGRLFAGCGDAEALAVKVLDLGFPLGRRLLAFEPLGRGFELKKDGPLSARPGETVEYRFTATNTGDLEVAFQVLDERLGAVTPALERLKPGEAWSGTSTYQVRDDDPALLVNRVTAVRWTEDGPFLLDTAEHLLIVDRGPTDEPALSLEVQPTEAYPWEKASFYFSLRNTGNVTLQDLVVCTFFDADTVASLDALPSGDTHVTAHIVLQVPGDAFGEEKIAWAVGYTEGEEAVKAEVSIQVRQPDDFRLINVLGDLVFGTGKLTQIRILYKAQIFTFEAFATMDVQDLVHLYPVLDVQKDANWPLARKYLSLARQLADAGIHVAEDILSLTDAELKKRLPELKGQVGELKKRARKLAEEQAESREEAAAAEPAEDFMGLDDMTRAWMDKLHQAGYGKLAELAAAEPEKVSEETGLDVGFVRQWKEQAAKDPDNFRTLWFLDKEEQRKLHQADVWTYQDLASQDPLKLGRKLRIKKKKADRWIRKAKEKLSER